MRVARGFLCLSFFLSFFFLLIRRFLLFCFQACSAAYLIAMTTLVQTCPVQMERLHSHDNIMPTFTRQDVRHHCDASSCWIIVEDKVYDVTRFLAEVSAWEA